MMAGFHHTWVLVPYWNRINNNLFVKLNVKSYQRMRRRMARGSHGLGPVMPNFFRPCRQPPVLGMAARRAPGLQPSCTPLDTPRRTLLRGWENGSCGRKGRKMSKSILSGSKWIFQVSQSRGEISKIYLLPFFIRISFSFVLVLIKSFD
jgi:hypothetical protein